MEGDIDGLHVRKLKDNATRVLVHSHSVIDLGADYEANEIKLRKLLNRAYSKAYQVELKNLFRNRTTAKNLEAIAKYVDLTDILYHRDRDIIALPPPDPVVAGLG